MKNRNALIEIEGYTPEYIEITRDGGKKELYMRTAEQLYAFGRWIASVHPRWMYMWDEKPVTMTGNAIICPVELIVIHSAAESSDGLPHHHSLGRSDWIATSCSAEDIATARTFAQGRILRNLGFSPYGFGEDPQSFIADRADRAEHDGMTHSSGMPMPNNSPAAEETKQNAKDRNPMLRSQAPRDNFSTQNAAPAPAHRQGERGQASDNRSRPNQMQQREATQTPAPEQNTTVSTDGMTLEEAYLVVFPGGKHGGKTVQEVCLNDLPYIQWIIKKGSAYSDKKIAAACALVGTKLS